MSTVLTHKRGVQATVPITVWDTNGAPIGATPKAGTWAIVFTGETSGTLNYNSVASDVTAALVAMSTVGTGNAVASGGPFSAGSAYSITYAEGLADVELPTFLNGLTGALNPTIAATTTDAGPPEIQSFAITSEVPTCYISKDGGYQAATTNSAASTGYAFRLVLSATEMTADVILVLPTLTGTTNVATPITIYTTNEPANLGSFSIDSDGRVDTSNAATLATLANQTTMLNRLGAWTGSGINTILGAFKALLSKASSAPSDIGGTFDPATDSVESLAEAIDGITVDVDEEAIADAVAAQSAVASALTSIGNIEDDTNELQTDWADGGRLDLLLDDVTGGGTTVNITTEGENITTDT